MKNILLLVLTLCLSNTASLFAQEKPIRVLTFNVRLSTANDGENAWSKRKSFLAEVITRFPDGNGPYDFVGTQETVLHPDAKFNQREYLASKLSGYAHIGRSRNKTPDKGEAMILFWKTDSWSLDVGDNGTFWLSDTPDVPGSKSHGAAYPRCVTFGLFHEINKEGGKTGRRVYVYNTHFDHISEAARQHAARVLLERIVARKDQAAPVILMGDFNSGEKSPAIRYLQGKESELDGVTQKPPMALKDTFRAVNANATEVGTFNSFKAPGRAKIDFIFVSAPLKPLSSQIIRTQRDGKYPSDHFPVEAILSF
ncbi:MAG: endonuclease/exonuclease/phosphatase family protein [Puniceicoccales bacterium]|nr:endonuclease/exonuclease/phosphatase family protein [Puniceicoccales bacterium]